MLAYITFCVVVATVAMVQGDDLQSKNFTNLQLDDVVFTDNLLFNHQVRSRLECTSLCSSTPGCLTFTFTQVSRLCKGHAMQVTSTSSSSSAPGTKAYSMPVQSPTYACPACSTTFDDETVAGGWTVIQRRCNGCEDFYGNWSVYVKGFGNPAGEFWIGLEELYVLTTSQRMEVRFDLEQYDGTTSYAVFSDFSVSGDGTYTLDFTDTMTSGNIVDQLYYNKGQPFSTKDKGSEQSCAVDRQAGWWYDNCSNTNLNSPYMPDSACTLGTWTCAQWVGFGPKDSNSLKTTQMKIRPHSRVLRFGYLPSLDIPLSEGVLRTPRLQNTTRTNQYFEWAHLRQKQSYRCFKMN